MVYNFHVRIGDALYRDEIGEDCPNIQYARAVARHKIQQLYLMYEISDIGKLARCRMLIEPENGMSEEIPFLTALCESASSLHNFAGRA